MPNSIKNGYKPEEDEMEDVMAGVKLSCSDFKDCSSWLPGKTYTATVKFSVDEVKEDKNGKSVLAQIEDIKAS